MISFLILASLCESFSLVNILSIVLRSLFASFLVMNSGYLALEKSDSYFASS